jgi:hypothetical protein
VFQIKHLYLYTTSGIASMMLLRRGVMCSFLSACVEVSAYPQNALVATEHLTWRPYLTCYPKGCVPMAAIRPCARNTCSCPQNRPSHLTPCRPGRRTRSRFLSPCLFNFLSAIFSNDDGEQNFPSFLTFFGVRWNAQIPFIAYFCSKVSLLCADLLPHRLVAYGPG